MGSATAVSAPKPATVRDIDPLFTDYDARLPMAAAGVVLSQIRFADDGPLSKARHIVAEVSNQSDVDKLCRLPIVWNGKVTQHFKPSTMTPSGRPIPVIRPKGSKRNLATSAETASNALAKLSFEDDDQPMPPDLTATAANTDPPNDSPESPSRTVWKTDNWVLAPPLQEGGDAKYLQLTCRRDDGSWDTTSGFSKSLSEICTISRKFT